jgi:hypothetical protein
MSFWKVRGSGSDFESSKILITEYSSVNQRHFDPSRKNLGQIQIFFFSEGINESRSIASVYDKSFISSSAEGSLPSAFTNHEQWIS